MNIALEKTEEFVNGVKRRTYGDAFVRGNNGESEGMPSRLCVQSQLISILSYVHLGGFMRTLEGCRAKIP